jgi:hypothetical protein
MPVKQLQHHMKPEYIYMAVVAPSCNIFPVIVALDKFNYLPKEARVFFYYLVLNCLVSIASSLLASYHLPNMPLFHLSTIIESVLLLYFFSFVFYKKKITGYIKIVMMLMPVLGCLNALFFQDIFLFNSYMLSLQSFIIIALCFGYWWHYSNDKRLPWSSFPLNWMISGLLLYFSSAFILFTFSNAVILFFSKAASILVWNIHATLTIIMYLLVSMGYTKYKN